MTMKSLLALGAAALAIGVFAASDLQAQGRGAAAKPFAYAAAPAEPETAAGGSPQARTAGYNAERNAYFGDLHVHTKYSFDAYIFNVRADPDDAYRYARGGVLGHPAGYQVRLSGPPLDFAAVTEHAEYLGVLPAMNTPGHPLAKIPYAPDLFSSDQAKIQQAFTRVGNSLRSGKPIKEMYDRATMGSAWKAVRDAAARHNDPGRFTTFVAYEYTATREGRNLHRNVFFPTDAAPDVPFSALDNRNPEKLWDWMDALRANGIESLAIPHNMNGSDGTMFERVTWAGKPITKAWADQRIRNEPLVEMSQIKGTSETHPSLSPNDEQANFEIMEWYIGGNNPVTKFAGGYARDALRAGVEFQAKQGFNPYKFGMIAASDTHNATPGSVEENAYVSKVGAFDGTPERRGSVPLNGKKVWEASDAPTDNRLRFQTWGASGLAGVWAEENTREAIYAALRRKETFATSGPRIRVRFFGGFDLPADLASRSDLTAQAYAKGVAMGGDLMPGAGAPKFLVWAMRDANSGWLQRAQIVKGWVENGETREQVFDVACSDGISPDPKTGRCADNGATVDLATCAIETKKGDVELKALWTDPNFDPKQHAFYYARVLENPSCRWSTWDALRNGSAPAPNLNPVIQERAWSSPIWYEPRA